MLDWGRYFERVNSSSSPSIMLPACSSHWLGLQELGYKGITVQESELVEVWLKEGVASLS